MSLAATRRRPSPAPPVPAEPGLGVRPFRWTRAAYERAVEAGVFPPGLRAELLDGEVLERMSPQKASHATAVQLTGEALQEAFGVGVSVRIQLPFNTAGPSVPEPDVAVVPGKARDYRAEHPREALLVVEVSDATLALDRGRKLAAYARADVPEYWIVNLVDGVVHVYREPAGETYRSLATYTPGQAVAPLARPEASVSVADLLP